MFFQEAEHRRITEQQQRSAVSPRKTSPPHMYPNTPSWNTLQPQQRQEKPLPDAIIQTLTQRVQNRVGMLDSKSPASGRRRSVYMSWYRTCSVQYPKSKGGLNLHQSPAADLISRKILNGGCIKTKQKTTNVLTETY